jgi:hypothetical protein
MTQPTTTDHIFIDASNLFIEGMRLSSYLRDPKPWVPVHSHPAFDFDFRIDLRRLRSVLCGSESDQRPLLVGSHSENSDLLFASAEHCGFETIVYERDMQNREKKVDSTIVMRALLAALDGDPETTRIVLVAGDSDYVPLVRELRRRRYSVEVVFWAHASRELQSAAHRFVALDPLIDLLRYEPPDAHPSLA